MPKLFTAKARKKLPLITIFLYHRYMQPWPINYEHKDEMDAMIQQRHELSKKIKEKLSNAYPSQLISQEIPADTAIAKETEAWDILSGEALLNFEAELG